MAFGGNGSEVDILIKLVTEQAENAAKAFAEGLVEGMQGAQRESRKTEQGFKGVGDEGKRAGDKVRDSFSGARGTIIATDSALNLFSKSLSAVRSGLSALKDAARLEGLEQSFTRLQENAGQLGSQTLAKLREATQGYVSDAELMQKANQALLLGLPTNNFDKLAGSAIKLGRAMGLDALSAIDSLTLGVGRQSKLILDNLGIIVDAEQAYQNFAAANGILGRELSDSEKQAAFTAEAYRKIEEAAAKTGDTTKTAGTAMEGLSAALQNTRDDFVKAISRSDELSAAVDRLAEASRRSKGNVQDLGDAVGTGLAVALESGNLLLQGFNALVDETAGGLQIIADKYDLLGQKQRALDPAIRQQRELNELFADFDDAGARGRQGDSLIERSRAAKALEAEKAARAQAAASNKFFGELAEDALGKVGLDRVPGLDPAEVKKLSREYQDIFKAALTGKKSAEEFAKAMDGVRKNTKLTADQQKAYERVVTNAFGAAKKSIEETKRAGEKASRDNQRELKQQKDDLDRFAAAVGDAFDVRIPQEFSRRLVEAFAKNKEAPNQLVDDLKRIGAEAQKAGVPLNALGREVKDLQKLRAEGGYAPGNFEGEAEFAEQRRKLDLENNIFGIDVGNLSGEMAETIQGALSDALSGVASAIVSGDGRAAADAVGSAVGSVVGAAIGTYLSGGNPAGTAAGASIGGSLGSMLDDLAVSLFGGDGAGTKARKAADRFFADMFDVDRLTVLINGQIERIRDLTFAGGAGQSGGILEGAAGLVAGAATGGAAGSVAGGLGGALGSNNPSFDAISLQDAFSQLPATVQNAFQAVGVSFEELLGLSDDISGQIGMVLANNIGANLQNLQVLIQTTGKGFEELGDQIINAFLDGTLSIEQAYGQLAALQSLFEQGIPGAVGAVDQAIDNFAAALEDGAGSRFLIDSLRDIGAEAGDLGQSLQSVAQQVGTSLGFSTQQVQLLFEAMKVVGLQSVQDLAQASTAQLIALAENIRRIQEGIAGFAGNITDPTAGATAPTNFAPGVPAAPKAPSRSGGSSGKSDAERKAEERRKKREQEFQALYKLVTASAEYERILEAINGEQVTQKEGTREIRELFDEVRQATNALEKAEREYQKALKQRKGNLSEASKAVEDAQKRLDDLTKSTKEANQIVERFDVTAVIPLVGSLNELGVVAKAAGVTLSGMTSTLVEGFIRGRLSLTEFRDELSKTENTLGEGIPDAIGDSATAIRNLFEGGKSGGLFSIDAFRDIFVEVGELFDKNLGPRRRTELQKLTQEFNDARDSLEALRQSGASQDLIGSAEDRLRGARKRLDDFNAALPQVSFADLRQELERTLSPEQIDIFMEALRENGINSFEDLKKAGDDTIVRILADLDEMGFGFGETSERVKEIVNRLDEAATAQTNGKDILGEALALVKDFNNFTGKFAGNFAATTVEVEKMNGPLATLASQVDAVFNKLAQLGSTPFNADVRLNVSVDGNTQALKLVDVLFGDGSGLTGDVGGPGPGLGLTSAERREFETLRRRLKVNGRLSAADLARFNDLRSRRAVGSAAA